MNNPNGSDSSNDRLEFITALWNHTTMLQRSEFVVIELNITKEMTIIFCRNI